MSATEEHDNGIRPVADHNRHLSEGRFMLLRSKSSGTYIFHPRVAEPLTGATDLEWTLASGYGVVYSTSVVRERAPARDYNIALIDLAEGPRMMSRVEGVAPDAVTIGMAVKALIIEDNGNPLVVFKPV